MSFPKLAPRTSAFRVVASLVVEKAGEAPVKVPITVHLIALGQGRGDVVLLAMGFGNGVATSDLRGFATLTARRLAAAKL